MHFVRLFLIASFLGHASVQALAQPKVITSIVPVHALVAGVMDGVATPSLLLSGLNSEHQASFGGAQLKALGEADVVFIIGGGLELKLDELSGSEAVKGKRFVELSTGDKVTKHRIREGGVWEVHEHEQEPDHDHGTAAYDPHVWLDPSNAKAMVAIIAAELAKVDAANAQRYAGNAQILTDEIDDLAEEVDAMLAPVKDKPYIVFHDAYQYFETRFGLSGVGSISDFSANAPSAKRLKEVRDKIAAAKAVCVFREPQFSDAAVATVIEGTGAKSAVLDPIGATLTPGKGAYRDLLMGLAQGLRACLALT